MREARYLSAEDLPAGGSLQGGSLSERDGELFLVFTIRPLGLCALPVAAVQTVCAADGPVRRVPQRGGAGSRFLGLVSVRGQVQMLFDLSVVPSLQGAVAVPPAREEPLLVTAAADGRTLALRVLPPLRLVRRKCVTEVGATGRADGLAGSDGGVVLVGNTDIYTGDGGSVRIGDGQGLPDDDEEVFNVCDFGISPPDDDAENTGQSSAADTNERDAAETSERDAAGTRRSDAADAGQGDTLEAGQSDGADAIPVCGSFVMPDAEDETVWLLGADALFTQLEAEARHG